MTFDREAYEADMEAGRWCQFVPKHERPVVGALTKALLDRGYTLAIHDGEEWACKRTTRYTKLRPMFGHAGEDWLVVYDTEGQRVGSWYLIYDNGSEGDPMVVISDYSWVPSTDYCQTADEIWNELQAKYED